LKKKDRFEKMKVITFPTKLEHNLVSKIRLIFQENEISRVVCFCEKRKKSREYQLIKEMKRRKLTKMNVVQYETIMKAMMGQLNT
jgi:hypothetical protein